MMIKRVELFRNVRQLVRFQVNKIQISVIDTNMDIQFTYWLRKMQCRFVSCNTCLSGSMLPMTTSVFRVLLNELWRYIIGIPPCAAIVVFFLIILYPVKICYLCNFCIDNHTITELLWFCVIEWQSSWIRFTTLLSGQRITSLISFNSLWTFN